ncbi:hypothetical protein UlMin_005625 [Ulmus minor]
MDIKEQSNQNGLQIFRRPWIPATPAKLLQTMPPPICTPSVAAEVANNVSDHKVQNTSFQGLLAMVEAAATKENDGAEKRHIFCAENKEIEDNQQKQATPFETSSFGCSDHKPADDSPTLNQHSYDLNLPLPCEEFGESIPQFEPLTPNKIVRVDQEQVSEIQNLTEAIKDGEGEEKKNEVILNTDVLNNDKETVSVPVLEDPSTNKGDDNGLVLNTPTQKQRRKKHRPKVVIEGKPKRTPKSATPNGSKENPTRKRKYTRKNVIKTTSETPLTEVADPGEDSRTKTTRKRSCRREINFVAERQETQSQEMQNNCEFPTKTEAPSKLHSAKTNSPQEKLNVGIHEANSKVEVTANAQQQNVARAKTSVRYTFSSASSQNNSGGTIVIDLTQDDDEEDYPAKKVDNSSKNLNGLHCKNLEEYKGKWPSIHKKKRTEKLQIHSRPSTSSCGLAENTSSHNFKVPAVLREVKRGVQGNLQSSECLVALSLDERPTKKRSRSISKPRDFKVARSGGVGEACLNSQAPAKHNKQRVSNTRARKTQSSRRNSQVVQRPASYDDQQRFFQLGACQKIDVIAEQLKRLSINRESSIVACQERSMIVSCNTTHQERSMIVSCNTMHQEQNAIVLLRRDGTVVPFTGPFVPTKKLRPKVDLDDETSRVWRLLLENINSEGIDGTDEEKAKWWENERSVFRGRADSFIARMHLVQGDRRFSKWKGSVLDSVIGVFLTQNVSDHLSSSAFMSVAAHYPVNSNLDKACTVADEPEVCISENNPSQPVCESSSSMLCDVEQNEVNGVNGKATSLNTDSVSSTNESECKLLNSSVTILETDAECCMEQDEKAVADLISSQQSVDSSISRTCDKLGSSSESNSEAEDLLPNRSKYDCMNDSTSHLEPLCKSESSMIQEVHFHGRGEMSPHDKLKDEHSQLIDAERESEIQSMDPAINHSLNVTTSSEVSIIGSFETCKEEIQSSDISQNKTNKSISGQSTLTVESANQSINHNKLIVTEEAPRSSSELCIISQGEENVIIESQSRLVGNVNNAEALTQEQNNKMERNLSIHLDDSQDVTMQKIPTSDLDGCSPMLSKKSSEVNASSLKSKTRPGKEKVEVDWDKLRRRAEANGRKRERTASTMDSVDWDAVRRADVNEIANTIKERGMNNRLAERIKDFLNRLVKDHGSINLEWLRDVPPDEAKEYLLSIKGLGLKSVECVRLLTLHHLAFPVDTNVGRIAVRLGWVPLQPLPESLQLHLLELYPILESIQKYLWPRLCKLDQRTLYELHYQLITFGKVFCTKSKPNCNACPMRGECRHFASAFASARLALPGPQEKGIVIATENRKEETNPTVVNYRAPLPLPHVSEQSEQDQPLESSQQLEKIAGVRNSGCEPIIEEPASPEPEFSKLSEEDIEDLCCEDPDEIPTIKLDIEEFNQTLHNYIQKNMELQAGDMSKALVALSPDAASIPMPKLKNVSRLRTEHQVYELPDSHPLLETLQMETRETDDPSSYLLAIWTPGETANSIEPPEGRCRFQECGQLCNEKECFSCNSAREAASQTVRGTILIPCRTAMRGSFPLNGTYFQVNEVFADHDSSLNPINVPRNWLWNLHRRTVYFGTSIPSIFKGFSTQGIQQCFWRGFVCVRGFDRKTRYPRPLMARLHFPASKLKRPRDRKEDE